MNRHLRRAILFTVPGVITTVAVSWVCAIMIEVTRDVPTQYWTSRSDPRWLVDVYEQRGAQRLILRPLFSPAWQANPSRDRIPFGADMQVMRKNLLRQTGERSDDVPGWSSASTTSADQLFAQNRDIFDDVIIEDARGWPWLALRCTYGPPVVQGIQARRDMTGGFPMPAILLGKKFKSGEAKALPIEPVWPGLIGDTLIFSAGWFVVVRIPVIVLRTWRRVWRRCPGCGYSRKNLRADRCPECGWLLCRSV